MRLVQIADGGTRRVAIVEEPQLLLLDGVASVLELASRALVEQVILTQLASSLRSAQQVSYNEVYECRSPWKLLAPVDCPGDVQKVLVSGTGLTHLGSARERQAMHAATMPKTDESQMTDSMRIFEWGVQRGRPASGEIGIAPEWFYKGDGSVVQAPFAPLQIPGFAEDGGEEGEIAAVYLIANDGTPHRIGMAIGNEFSDHVFERRNYLNLAGSKLRMCSLGPELVIDADFEDGPGEVSVERNGATLWQKQIRTGEANMAHSLRNLEHHHFKFAGHRQPGTLHIHYFGADALSFGDGVRLGAGDLMKVHFKGFGRPLVNPVTVEEALRATVPVSVMQ